MKIYDRNGTVAYECDLTGIELHRHYADCLELGWDPALEDPNFNSPFVAMRGSTLMWGGNLGRDLDTPIDTRRSIELAARRLDYTVGWDIKHYVTTPLGFVDK